MSKEKLSRNDIKALEEEYGKHNFCYQCGNPDIKPIEDSHLYPDYKWCPKCGSSDVDAG